MDGAAYWRAYPLMIPDEILRIENLTVRYRSADSKHTNRTQPAIQARRGHKRLPPVIPVRQRFRLPQQVILTEPKPAYGT